MKALVTGPRLLLMAFVTVTSKLSKNDIRLPIWSDRKTNNVFRSQQFVEGIVFGPKDLLFRLRTVRPVLSDIIQNILELKRYKHCHIRGIVP